VVQDYNDYEIDCACGYTVLVPRSRIGDTVECLACGDTVFVDPARVRRAAHEEELHSALRAPAPQPSAPASPFAEPAASSAEEPATVEPEKISAAREAPAMPEVARPSARSPFEEPENEASAADAQSATTVPPPPMERTGSIQANRFYSDVVAGTERPKPAMAEPEEIEAEGNCARCGRPFRGAWDQFETETGVICYICSNQATEGAPERIKRAEEQKRQAPPPKRASDGDHFEAHGPPKFWLFDPESRGFRIMLWVLALGTVGIAVFLPFFEPAIEPTSSSSTGAGVGRSVLPEEPTWWMWAVFYVQSAGGGLLATFLSIYWTLYIVNRLPHETFKLNVLAVGWATLVVSAIGFGGWIIIQLAFAWVGSFALAISLPLVVVMFFAIVGVLMNLLDFRIRDFVLLFFISTPANFAGQAVAALTVGGLINLLT
jgi:hypothetical protein